MITTSPLDRIPASVRLLLLVALPATGLAVMWYFANFVAPREGFLSNRARKPGPHAENASRSGATSGVADLSSPHRASPASAPPASSEEAGTKASNLALGDSPLDRLASAENEPSNSAKPPRGGAPHRKPHPPRVVTRAEGLFIETEPILFDTGRAKIHHRSFQTLNALAALLIERPEMRVSINGYTDNLGPESTNQELSIERAEAVLKYLMTQGVDRARLEAKGWGSQEPIASNDTLSGRQSNRRIEFLVTNPR